MVKINCITDQWLKVDRSYESCFGENDERKRFIIGELNKFYEKDSSQMKLVSRPSNGGPKSQRMSIKKES